MYMILFLKFLEHKTKSTVRDLKHIRRDIVNNYLWREQGDIKI